jgi:hypothetical protein
MCFSRKNEKKLCQSFDFTFHYFDNVSSPNTFGEFVNIIYPIELEIKDTTDPTRSASHLEIHIEIDSEEDRLGMKVQNERDYLKYI